jgi:hypothetical protein
MLSPKDPNAARLTPRAKGCKIIGELNDAQTCRFEPGRSCSHGFVLL